MIWTQDVASDRISVWKAIILKAIEFDKNWTKL